MAEFFGNKAKGNQGNNLETQYKSSIGNLLIVVCFSVVNIVLLLTNSDTYFLFSAFVPYFIVNNGMYLCGLYPEEYYYDMPDMEFMDKSFLAVTVVIAVVVLLVYLLCWFLAKKKKVGALIFALVFFVIDTVGMLWMTGFSMDSVIDIIFHIWVIVYLIIGILAYYKIKKSPETDDEISEDETGDETEENSEILRMAEDVKCRVFLEADVSGMHIVYRRVKRTNELVINGYVYDEYVALAEFAHTLVANVNGHKVEASFNGVANVFISVDSQIVAKKMRLY